MSVNNHQAISALTKAFGIIGNPVSHSLSPLMHNTALKHLGIDGVYLAFSVIGEELEGAIRSIKALGFVGVNVTVPYKTMVPAFLDELRGDATLTGSVNTIVNEDGRLIGYSTDGLGFARSLKTEAGWEAGGKSAIILGAGGAATAVAFRLVQEGISKLLILSRDEAKGRSLSELIFAKTGFQPEYGIFASGGWQNSVEDYALVVNTTPVGMISERSGEMPPFSPKWASAKTLLYDLVYNPLETPWLREARHIGRETLSGLGMLVYQGAESFRLWTGREMPVNEVFSVLKERFNHDAE